jgi:hypothetical protein
MWRDQSILQTHIVQLQRYGFGFLQHNDNGVLRDEDAREEQTQPGGSKRMAGCILIETWDAINWKFRMMYLRRQFSPCSSESHPGACPGP